MTSEAPTEVELSLLASYTAITLFIHQHDSYISIIDGIHIRIRKVWKRTASVTST